MAFKKTWTNKGSHWHTHKYDCISKNHQDYIKEYRIWNAMKNRCYNQSCDMYSTYGGRGIKICDRWLGEDGFINFYNDMGKRPIGKDGRAYQIDRIDNNGDYCPENCRWVHPSINARNRSDNIYIFIYGDRYCASDACKMFGINRTTVTEGVRVRGKSPTDAFSDALERRKNERLAISE